MMEQDKQLKQILLNSAGGASAHFTDTVMHKITKLSATPFHYKPLVHPKMIRFFLVAFGAVVVCIFSLCLMMLLPPFHVASWLRNQKLPDVNYSRIVLFILTFWIVFSVNALFEMKFWSRRKPSF